MHDVGALGTPVANDTLSAELEFYHLLVLMIRVRSALEFTNLLEACRGRHELEDAVDGERAAHLCLEG